MEWMESHRSSDQGDGYEDKAILIFTIMPIIYMFKDKSTIMIIIYHCVPLLGDRMDGLPLKQ